MTFRFRESTCSKYFLCLLIFITPIFSQAQRVTTVAGGSGDGGHALDADLFGPTTVAVDKSGNIFIADAASRTIRKVNISTGIITRFAGNGILGYSGDGGPAIDASFGDPSGVAIDASNNIYISDQLYSNIRKIDATTGVITRISGDANGASGFTSDNALAIGARLFSPHALTIDPAGNIYITDTGNQRIRRIDASTKIITTVAGNGTFGYSGDNNAATSASLSNPNSVAVDNNGNVYIADYGNNRVRVVNATTGVITTVAGNGTQDFGGDDGLASQSKLNAPSGVLIDAQGNLIIADTYNQRIRKVNMNTSIITTLAGTGVTGFLDGPVLQARLDVPQSLAADVNGNLYLSEYVNRRIRKITGTTITTVVGNGGYDGDGSLATEASLKNPQGVAVDAIGNLYIADMLNQRIRKVDYLTKNILTIAGDGSNQYGGDGGLASNAQLYWPRTIVLDKDENLFIADAANHRVRKIDKITGIITTVAGNGSPSYQGDGGLATNASIYNPIGLAFDSQGNLYIADTNNNCIRKVAKGTGIITTVAGNGTVGFSGDDDVATAAQFNSPHRIAFDTNDNLYIADMFNNRVRKVSASTNIVTTIAGAGNGSDNGSALSASVVFPSDVIVAEDGDVYILEPYHIRKITASTGLISTIAGKGRGYFGDSGAALDAHFSFMTNFVRDKAGNFFLADVENNRIRKIKARVPQIITFDALAPKTFGDEKFDLSATSSSGLTVAYNSSNINVATVTGKILTIVGAGTATITALQTGDIDFLPAPIISQPLIINKASQTITFDALTSKTFGESSFDLNASSSSGLLVTFSSSINTVATVNGKTVTILGAGTATITALQTGNNNYLAATSVEQSLSVSKASQIITFNAITSKTLGDAPFNLGASTTSGLAVTYSSSSEEISISGNQISLVKAGRATVKANQEGNSNYKDATTVEQSFCINPSKPAIAVAVQPSTSEFILTSNQDIGNQWYLNDTEIPMASQKTFTVKNEGVYTVQVTIEDCKSVLSDQTVKIITAVSDEIMAPLILIYPNPAVDLIMAEVKSKDQEQLIFKINDATGRGLSSKKGNTNEVVALDVSGLTAGVYFINVVSEEGSHVIRFYKR